MNELTYSEIIYLFANSLVPERSKFFNYDNHPTGEKISVKPLSYKMVMAALFFLIEKGCVTISVKDVKKLIFLSRKEIFVKKIKDGNDLSGIEKALLDNVKNDVELRKAVFNLLDNDETSPWGHVILISKDSLLRKGYLILEKEKKIFFP